jgi:hypothetical protein
MFAVDMSLKRLSTGQDDETESRKKVCTPVSRCLELPRTSENGSYQNGSQGSESLKEGMYRMFVVQVISSFLDMSSFGFKLVAIK